MKPTDYVKNVLVTEARDFAPLQERFAQIRNIRLLHGIMGLSSELSEIQVMANAQNIDVVNLKEEMGDLYWYMGIIVNELGFDPEEVFSHDTVTSPSKRMTDEMKIIALRENVSLMVFEIGEIADLLKKSIMYGKMLHDLRIRDELKSLDFTINVCLSLYDMRGGEARERNIEKLRARYGEKFTEAAALERDLAKEREILEKK